MLRLIFAVAVAALLIVPVGAGEDDAKTHYDAARKAEKVRDFRTAMAEYERALDIDAEYLDVVERYDACELLVEWQDDVEGGVDATALVRLGEIFAGLQRLEQERAAYEEAIVLDPDHTDAHGHLALFHYSSRARGRSMVTVMEQTRRYLETSPYREFLEKPLADLEIYGRYRTMRELLRDVIRASNAAAKVGELAEAAAVLEKAAVAPEHPDVFRTVLYAEAGMLRHEARDAAGARKAFEAALTHVECGETITARIGLAILDVEAGKHATALAHLRAAVKLGSRACLRIRGLAETSFSPLFTSPDGKIRAETKLLADVDRADDPIRAEIEAACEKAGREKKLVLLHWYGPYCPFVLALEERLAHPLVRKVIAEKFVHYRVDLGLHERAVSLEREYGNIMDEHGVPSFYVLLPDGTIHSIQKDVDLLAESRRQYLVENIVAWLESVEVE